MANTPRTRRDPRQEELRKLGERVRAERLRQKLTQQDLAGALGISVAYVSLIERGARNPPFTTLVALAHALGVQATRLLPA
jgi:transcriptional regulator with XRE-family HTH domain